MTNFYLGQTSPSDMNMTPGATDRDYKSGLEGSASSHHSFGGLMGVGINQNLGGNNIYIAGT